MALSASLSQICRRKMPFNRHLLHNRHSFNSGLLCIKHVLALPDFTQPFTVETDVSSTGMGVVLQQNGHPIAYISKAFGPRNKAMSVYERELLAITFTVSKWRHN